MTTSLVVALCIFGFLFAVGLGMVMRSKNDQDWAIRIIGYVFCASLVFLTLGLVWRTGMDQARYLCDCPKCHAIMNHDPATEKTP